MVKRFLLIDDDVAHRQLQQPAAIPPSLLRDRWVKELNSV